MTTYSYTGFSLDWSATTGDLIAIAPTTLSVVTADADDSFSYSLIGTPPLADLPPVEITGTEPYNMLLGDLALGSELDAAIGQVGWGSGNLSYVISFTDTATFDDYLFLLGGTPFPTFSSEAEFEAFEAGIVTIGPITSGSFTPGATIDHDALAGVIVTENDIIQGDETRNKFYGGVGADKIYGEAGGDKLYGNGGNDKLWGGDQADYLHGGTGRDKLYGGNGTDTLLGYDGNDLLSGGNFADKLLGGSGSDVLFGKAGNDILSGGRHFDMLEGGKGNDTLEGGKGNDDMRGGLGADVFLYSGIANEGGDVIFDFTSGVDMIHIGGGVTFADVTIEGGEFATDLSWNDTTVVMFNVDVATIGADDFMLV